LEVGNAEENYEYEETYKEELRSREVEEGRNK
jgi:hypothetical protein